MLGVGIALSRPGAGTRWWPEGASYALDLVERRAMIDGVAVPFEAACSFSRASEKWAQSSDGVWRLFAPDEPAITDRGMLLEPAFTELGNFADCSGAVPGVLGAGGALPTGWSETATACGVTVTVLGSGIADNGLPYVDIRFAGTPTDNWRIRPSPVRHLSVTGGVSYVASAWVALIEGVLSDPSHLRMGPVWYGAGGVYLSAGLQDMASVVDSMLTCVVFPNLAPVGASAANVDFFSVSAGKEIYFAIRMLAPNMGAAPGPSSPQLSTGTPKTRAEDQLALLLPAGSHELTAVIESKPAFGPWSASGTHIIDGGIIGGYAKQILGWRN